MVRFVTIAKFAAESGYTENAIRSKIRDGVWQAAKIWVKAPDGRILIDIRGYEEWVETAKSTSSPKRSKSRAHSVRARDGSPPPLA